jgi:hypothetical protein
VVRSRSRVRPSRKTRVVKTKLGSMGSKVRKEWTWRRIAVPATVRSQGSSRVCKAKARCLRKGREGGFETCATVSGEALVLQVMKRLARREDAGRRLGKHGVSTGTSCICRAYKDLCEHPSISFLSRPVVCSTSRACVRPFVSTHLCPCLDHKARYRPLSQSGAPRATNIPPTTPSDRSPAPIPSSISRLADAPFRRR